MPRVRRTELKHYPCVADFFLIEAGTSMCEGDDPEYCPGHAKCSMLPIYRQAIADARCAKVMQRFAQQVLARATALGAAKFMARAKRYQELIRDALRMAGLEG